MTPYYESDRAVAEYLLFHYGDDGVILPWSFGPRDALGFPVRCVRDCVLTERLGPTARALDLGCAVGRSAFELARHCGSVTAVDLSSRFVEAARRLQRDGMLEYPVQVEGEVTVKAIARVPDGVDAGRVRFGVGDALALGPDHGDYDVVLAANLLDRVPRPRALLEGFARLVKTGGQLVLTSPYTWLEEYTPAQEWLARDGQRASERLAEDLPGFQRVRRLDLPFLIREHARKYQWSVAEATVWMRQDPGR
ncbi:MAG: putative 4-mercaptohistidine N1-methyltransferase [Verrucomicrobiae bacterium]|nr:putative 4-mercaptohistidine N1-methyltransferase [Verrucomicrobiae bacterium]